MTMWTVFSLALLICVQTTQHTVTGFVGIGHRPSTLSINGLQQRQTSSSSSSLSSAVAATTSSSSSPSPPPPPLAPLTLWGDTITDIRTLQKQMNEQVVLPEFGIEISAKDLQLSNMDDEIKYFQQNANTIKYMLQQHGAIIFRNFTLMKKQNGFQTFYETIGMKPCLDPLHSVSARPTLDGSKNSAIYEAVNKESRKNFFIGMHNEFVGTRAPRAAAFGCFKAAEVGGEFIIADGRQIFRQVDPDILYELYTKQIRYSVMELPFFDWLMNIPTPFQRPIESMIQVLVSAAINAKVDFNVDLSWQGEGSYETNNPTKMNSKFLQARAPRQPPVVLHPITKDPTWFCNVHSHSSKLRRDREDIYGAERFEDGASRINKSDMYFGDDTPLSMKQLQHLDDITKQNMKYIKMNEGDVVLLDNYKTMHGRNVFDGTRKHGVCWFEGWTGEEEMIAEVLQQQQQQLGQPAVTKKETPFFAVAK